MLKIVFCTSLHTQAHTWRHTVHTVHIREIGCTSSVRCFLWKSLVMHLSLPISGWICKMFQQQLTQISQRVRKKMPCAARILNERVLLAALRVAEAWQMWENPQLWDEGLGCGLLVNWKVVLNVNYRLLSRSMLLSARWKASRASPWLIPTWWRLPCKKRKQSHERLQSPSLMDGNKGGKHFYITSYQISFKKCLYVFFFPICMKKVLVVILQHNWQ